MEHIKTTWVYVFRLKKCIQNPACFSSHKLANKVYKIATSENGQKIAGPHLNLTLAEVLHTEPLGRGDLESLECVRILSKGVKGLQRLMYCCRMSW